jgi:murein tripeptide amidase MpaA
MPPRVNTAFMSSRFDCLAVTLEMPFKDAANSPLPEVGWSPARSAKLGAAMLDALIRVCVVPVHQTAFAPVSLCQN